MLLKLFQKLLSPTYSPLWKWRTNLKAWPFSNFAFLIDYYWGIWNKGIVYPQRYLLLTRSTRQCHIFALVPFVLLGGRWTMQASCIWSVWVSWKKRCQWVCALNLYVFVQTIFKFENPIWTSSCAIFIFHPQAHVDDQCQRQNVHTLFYMEFTSPKIHPHDALNVVRVTSLVGVPRLKIDFLDFYKMIFVSIHERFIQKCKIKSILTPILTF